MTKYTDVVNTRYNHLFRKPCFKGADQITHAKNVWSIYIPSGQEPPVILWSNWNDLDGILCPKYRIEASSYPPISSGSSIRKKSTVNTNSKRKLKVLPTVPWSYVNNSSIQFHCPEHETKVWSECVFIKQALCGLAPGITALSRIVWFVGNTFSHGPCQWRRNMSAP